MSIANQSVPKLPSFDWEPKTSCELTRKHNELFNDLALKQKYRTKSGRIMSLDYREPRLQVSRSTEAPTLAAPLPPTLESIAEWRWLDAVDGDLVRTFEDLNSANTANSSKPRSSCAPEQLSRFSTLPSSSVRSSRTALGNVQESSSQVDWSQADEKSHKKSFLKRLLSKKS